MDAVYESLRELLHNGKPGTPEAAALQDRMAKSAADQIAALEDLRLAEAQASSTALPLRTSLATLTRSTAVSRIWTKP